MKIALLSDIHANLQALTAVLRDCERQGVEEFWLLGDYLDYGASGPETVALLSSLNASCILWGNHDGCLFDSEVRSSSTPHGRVAYEYTKQVAQANPGMMDWIKSAGQGSSLFLPEKKTLLVHGTPGDPYWGKFTPEGDTEAMFAEMERRDITFMLMGHSHVSFLLRKSGRIILNPGSVGQPRDGCPHAAYGILDDGEIRFCRVPYDVETAAGEIQKAGLPEYLWKRLYTGS